MNSWHILTECYIDTLLAEVLSPAKKGYNHQQCCTKVLGTMKEKFSNDAVLGIIDNDKFKPKDLADFSLLKKHNEQLSIYKHHDKSKSHYVIIIGKAVEDFILKNVQKSNIELVEYDLPSDLDGLRKITKHTKSLKDAEIKFKKLFSALKQDENSDFYKLAQWIEYFKADPYDLNIESL